MATIFTCGNGNQILAPSSRTDFAANCIHWHKLDEVNEIMADSGNANKRLDTKTGTPTFQHTGFGGINCVRTATTSSIYRGTNDSVAMNDFTIGQLIRYESFDGAVASADGYVVVCYGVAYSYLILLWSDVASPTGDVYAMLYTQDAIGTQVYTKSSTACIKKDTDHSVFISRKVADGEVKFIVDGEVESTGTGSAYTTNASQYLTAYGGYGQNYTPIGELAHGEIWDKILTVGDIVLPSGGTRPHRATGRGIFRGTH